MGQPSESSRVLIFGVSREKDIRSMILSLAPHFEKIFTIAANHPRAVPAKELSDCLRELRVDSQPLQDFQQVYELLQDTETELVVCGSIFLVGSFLDWRDSTVLSK